MLDFVRLLNIRSRSKFIGYRMSQLFLLSFVMVHAKSRRAARVFQDIDLRESRDHPIRLLNHHPIGQYH